MENTKVCSKCGRELPTSEFNKDKKAKDGLQRYCKECQKQYKSKWYGEHADEKAEYNKQYYKQYRADYFKQYNAEHKEEIAEYHKQYNAKRYTTIEGYTYKVRQNNLQHDIEHGRCGKDEDPLPPHSYYIEKFSEGIDYYDGKKYPFNELGFDRKDDKLPHTIDNIVVATTFHNKDRWYKRMTVEEYREYMQKQKEELELVLN